MKPDNEKFLRYLLLASLVTLLAICLMLAFHTSYRGTGFLGDPGYIIYGFFLHGPVWLLFFLLADLVFKIRIPRPAVFVLEGLLFVLLLLPFVYDPSADAYNYIEIGYHIVDFLLCLALLTKLRLRLVKA